MMKELISDFSKQIETALTIFEDNKQALPQLKYKNIVISGLGGSGIGGTIMKDLSFESSSIPVIINKDYQIPSFVDSETLFIASSYSGDTEETLYAVNEAMKKTSNLLFITSGGKLKKLGEEKSIPTYVIPGGNPPRACLGYSLTILICIFKDLGLMPTTSIDYLKKSISILNEKEDQIRKDALNLAKIIQSKNVIIYSDAKFEGVAVRFRQQLNENSKMLCWHHVVPEMNHNELVGWTKEMNDHVVLFLRNTSDFERNQFRIKINQDIIKGYCLNVIDVWSLGDSNIERALYTIHLLDWVSYDLSELNKVDVMQIDVINFLKGKLNDL